MLLWWSLGLQLWQDLRSRSEVCRADADEVQSSSDEGPGSDEGQGHVPGHQRSKGQVRQQQLIIMVIGTCCVLPTWYLNKRIYLHTYIGSGQSLPSTKIRWRSSKWQCWQERWQKRYISYWMRSMNVSMNEWMTDEWIIDEQLLHLIWSYVVCFCRVHQAGKDEENSEDDEQSIYRLTRWEGGR